MYFQNFPWRRWIFSFVPLLWWVFSLLFLHLLLGFQTFCLPLFCSHCLNANKALGSYKQRKLFLKEENTFTKYDTDPKESSTVKLKNFFKDERYFHFASLSGRALSPLVTLSFGLSNIVPSTTLSSWCKEGSKVL